MTRATRRLLVRLLNPGCHERNGVFVRDTQLLLDGQWVEVEMEALAPGDVFRQCEGTSGWGVPFVAIEKSFPDGDLGNFGVKAELVPRALFQKIGIPT